jgi:TPR repeat protein
LLYENKLNDYPNAIKWFETAYKQGDKQGAYALGILYEDNLKDYPSAIKWYEIAHKQGNKEAPYALALLYDDTLKDYPKAFEWYSTAYDKNNKHFGALYKIGFAYLEGKGVKKDLVEAKRLLRLAADNGIDEAKEALKQLDEIKH